MNESVDATMARWRSAVDAELAKVVSIGPKLPDRLSRAIHYSVTGEGKRLRGLLLMATYQAVGGRGDAAGLAAAVEVVHAYSLVHDDLPCMDNDDLRRGRATTHRAFDVAAATVAGVAMVPLAVELTVRSAKRLDLDDRVTRSLVQRLMRASGPTGMVGGQWLDLDGEGRQLPVEALERVHRAKTGALIEAAFAMGGIAGGGSAAQVIALSEVAAALGLAFQIADDVLDVTASSAALGKTAGSDAARSKSTYVSTLGVDAARRWSDTLVANAMTRLSDGGLRTPVLDHLAHFVAARRS